MTDGGEAREEEMGSQRFEQGLEKREDPGGMHVNKHKIVSYPVSPVDESVRER
jgi:hypothetical protein